MALSLYPNSDPPDDDMEKQVARIRADIRQGKVKDGLMLERMLESMSPKTYRTAMLHLAKTWRRRGALADKNIEVEGRVYIELIKIIAAQNFIDLSLQKSIEVTCAIQELEKLFSDNDRVMALIEDAYGNVRDARNQAVSRLLNMLDKM